PKTTDPQTGDPKTGDPKTGDPKTGEHKVRPYVVGTNTAGPNGRPRGTLPDTVGRIVQAFKSITTHEYTIGVKQRGWPSYPGKLWQRNYYEHIIRNENEFTRIREYIVNNPQKWELDRENPDVSIFETPAVQQKGQS
ncbi:MAG: transposase, partial [Pseudomonadota bacterium]|nr:transposase [Pseudomonadota bacterium]